MSVKSSLTLITLITLYSSQLTTQQTTQAAQSQLDQNLPHQFKSQDGLLFPITQQNLSSKIKQNDYTFVTFLNKEDISRQDVQFSKQVSLAIKELQKHKDYHHKRFGHYLYSQDLPQRLQEVLQLKDTTLPKTKLFQKSIRSQKTYSGGITFRFIEQWFKRVTRKIEVKKSVELTDLMHLMKEGDRYDQLFLYYGDIQDGQNQHFLNWMKVSQMFRFYQFYHTGDAKIIKAVLNLEFSIREKEERIKNQDSFVLSLQDKGIGKFQSIEVMDFDGISLSQKQIKDFIKITTGPQVKQANRQLMLQWNTQKLNTAYFIHESQDQYQRLNSYQLFKQACLVKYEISQVNCATLDYSNKFDYTFIENQFSYRVFFDGKWQQPIPVILFLKYKETINTAYKYILYKLTKPNDVKLFFKKVLQNQWPEYLNSAPKVKAYDPNSSIDIVQSQFEEEVVNNDKDVLLMQYTDEEYCKECKAGLSFMLRLSQQLQSMVRKVDVKIVTMNGRLNDLKQIKANKYPVYYAYFKDQKDKGVYVVQPPVNSTRADFAFNWVLFTLPHLQNFDL